MAIDFKRFLKAIGVKNSTDMSKQLIIQVSDSATTGTTTTLVAAQTSDVTVTLPTQSGAIPTASGAFTSGRIVAANVSGQLTTSPSITLDANAQKIGNMADPTVAQDAATKAYVDSVVISGGANTTLSNLVSPTAINQDLIFGTGLTGNLETNPETFNTQSMNVRSGDSGNNSGTVNIVSGQAVNTSGSLQLNTGDSSTGNSGPIVLTTGSAAGTRGVVFVDALELDMNSTKIVNMDDPTAPQDAATKAYVDSQVGGSGANVTLSNLTAPIDVNVQNFILGGGFASNTITTKDLAGSTADLIIRTGLAGNGDSGVLQIHSSDSSGPNQPGSVTLSGGSLTSTSGTAASVSVLGGNAGGSGVSSGALTLKSGNSSTYNSSGVTLASGTAGNQSGDLSIESGTGAQSGTVNIKTAVGTNYSGNITLTTGQGQTNDSGLISLTTGQSTAQKSGAINLVTGTSTGNDSGNISLTTANSSGGSKKAGNINITAGFNGTVSGGGEVNISTTGGGTSGGKINLTTPNNASGPVGQINLTTGNSAFGGGTIAMTTNTSAAFSNIIMTTNIIDASQSSTGMIMPNRTSDPTGIAGMIYYNVSTGKFRGFNGSVWQDLN